MPPGLLRLLLLLTLPLAGSANPVMVRPNEIEFTATVHAKAFDGAWSMPGYHAVAWKDGRSGHAALLEAEVSDTDVLDALERLGARAGNNVPMEAWDKRRDRSNKAPDTAMTGPAVELLLRLPGRAGLVPLADVLQDSGGRGLDLRFGGNRDNIPKWKSGCIVCLYSCPGAKVGNARYTMRDYVDGVTRFTTRPGTLPADGTPVGVVLRLAPVRAALCPPVDRPAPAAGSYRIFRDPVTGQVRAPTPQEAARIAAEESAAAGPAPAFEIVVHPDGMQSVDLHGAFAAKLVITRAPDGTLTVTCLPSGANPPPAPARTPALEEK